ncbi:MAG: transporter substrate-binding domain-containing protein [Alphaproteobacteria bacterium]|nr:transporter substrate-binding domain-containing protein [Alphaproteobacteria bacterium]
MIRQAGWTRRGVVACGLATLLTRPSLGQPAPGLTSPLRMVFFPFPPFNYVDAAGQPQGDLVVLFRRMCEHLGVESDVREFPVARARQMIINGEADVLLTNNAAPELQGHILSSSNPIDEIVIQAFTLDPTLRIRTLNDLRGRSVILQQRFAYGGIRTFIETPTNDVRITGEPNDTASGLRMLLARRGQIYVQYRNKLQEAQTEVGSSVELFSHTLNVISIYINVSARHPHAKLLLDRLVEAYAAVRPQPGRSDTPLEEQLAQYNPVWRLTK